MLADYLDQRDDTYFILGKDIEGFRYIKKREKIIRENMPGVLQGLACATKNIAEDILKGDSSIFTEVMNYYEELLKKQYGGW